MLARSILRRRGWRRRQCAGETDLQTERDREAQRGTARDRERRRGTERDRERQRESDGDRDSSTETQKIGAQLN